LDEEENNRAKKKWQEHLKALKADAYTIKEMLVTYSYYISLSI